MIYWTYINKELVDLQPIFEKSFQGLSLIRDYEDTWEWLIGKSEDESEFNISRKHNFEKGLYDTELIISIKCKNENSFDIDRLGSLFKELLETEIYFGNKILLKGNLYAFEVNKKY